MENSEPNPFPAHLERHLGPITYGWSDSNEGHGVQVVEFKGRPESNVNTFATLGLSDYSLKLPSTREVRQELMMSANAEFSADAIAGLLLSLAERVLERRKALVRGEVIGPGPKIAPNSILTEIFVTNPSPFDALLTQFSMSPPLVLAYLIPLSSAEASLVRTRGWRWFEEELQAQDPDIWDLARKVEIVA